MRQHQWGRGPSGEVARSTYHSALRLWHRHKGPRCAVCDFFFCDDCDPLGWHRSCPGPAPEGTRWDWVGVGGGTPPIEPELRNVSVWD